MSNKEELKVGDKVKIIDNAFFNKKALYHLKAREAMGNFKCFYIIVTDIINPHGCSVNFIDYKGIVKADGFFYFYEIEKTD